MCAFCVFEMICVIAGVGEFVSICVLNVCVCACVCMRACVCVCVYVFMCMYVCVIASAGVE